MIDFDEVVETSDAEELEEIAAQNAYLPRIRYSSELETGHFTESPRKRFKLSPELQDQNIVPLQKFAGTPVLTPRKVKAFPPLTATNSPVQVQVSVSLPRTPDYASVSSIFKEEDDEASMTIDSAEPDYSQDPLLLCSPPKSPSISQISSDYEPLSFPTTPLMTSEDGHSTTPKESPPRPLVDLRSFDVPLLSSPSPSVRAMTPELSFQNLNNDDLLLFTPIKLSSQSLFSSPLTSHAMKDNTTKVHYSPTGSHSPSSSEHVSAEKMPIAASTTAEPPDDMEEEHRLPLPSSASVRAVTPESSSQNPTALDGGDLPLFTPVKPLSQSLFSSPLTPVIDHSTKDPAQESQRSPSVPRSRSSSKSVSPERMPSPALPTAETLNNVDEDRRLAMDLAENDSGQTTRYPLRARKLHQKMPFTADQWAYQRQLRENPEAIVKFKALGRHHHRPNHPDDHYEPETQQDDDDAEWERRERRRLQREEQRKAEAARRPETGEQDLPQFPGLEDLSSTDEDERKAMDETTKEARRLVKGMAKQRKAQEKAERERRKEEERAERERRKEEEQRKVKPFPMSKRTFMPPKATSSRFAKSPSPSDQSDKPFDNRSEKSKGKQRAVEIESDGNKDDGPNPSRSEYDQAIHDYFEHDDYQAYDNDYPMQDVDADAVHENPASSPSPDVLKNTYDTAIPVDSDDENDRHGASTSTSNRERSKSVRSDSNIIIDLPSHKKHALNRMMPQSMINRDAKAQQPQKPKPRTVRDSKKDNVPDGPLLPGQTRVQVAAVPKETREIKGDSESEIEIDSDSDESAHSSLEVSDGDEIMGLYKNIPQVKKQKLIKRAELELSDPVDAHFSTGRRAAKGAINNIRDPNGIQFMLVRGKRTDYARYESDGVEGEPRNGQGSRFKLDVITNGARGQGTSKQTLLSFSSSKGRKKPSKSGNRASRPSGSKRPAMESDGDSGSDEVQIVEVPDKKTIKMQRKRAMRSYKKANGVYTVVRKNHIITSGRSRETAFITLQLEEEDPFYEVFVPPKSDSGSRKSRTPVQFPPSPVPVNIAHSSQEIEADKVEKSTKSNSEIPSDFRLSVLSVGRFFNASTYIRKCWLFEAVNASSETQERLQSLEMFGFELDIGLGVENFSSMLPNICDAVLEYATSLPDPDAERLNDQWSTFLHLVSQFITWYLQHGDEDAVKSFYQDAKRDIMKLVDSIQQLQLRHIEAHVLIICRFLIDASLRLDVRNSADEPDSARLLNASADLAVSTLLKVGFAGIVDDLINDADLDSSTTSRCAAELWVCLIHVLEKSAARRGIDRETTKPHPFWELFLDNLQKFVVNRPNKAKAMFEVTEIVWLAIFIICTMSRFSTTGMAVSQSHLPPCWDVVVFALGLVRLEGALLGNQTTDADKKRDRYIALLVVRCFQLHNTWKWGLGTAFKMFYKLGGIFKSRAFANLLHEGANYPEFFRQTNWDLLSSYHEDDSAYAVFLKLVFRAFNDQSCSSWIKKLESLAVPIGSLPFTKDNPLDEDSDKAKLYNRFAAIALLADLNPDLCADKVSRARNYVLFSAADPRSREVIISGIQNWACLLIERRRKVSVMGDWIEELAKALVAEQKELSLQSESPKVRKQMKNVYDDIKLLLGAISNIYDAYRAHALYPEPFLLMRIKPVLYLLKVLAYLHQSEASESSSSKPNNKIDDIRLGDVLSSFSVRLFMARRTALPLLERPSLPAVQPVEEDSQESQDYGDFGLDEIDWSDTANLPGALQPVVGKPSVEDLEKEMRNALVATNFRWLAFEYLKPYLLMTSEHEKRASNIDLWLHIMLACSYAEGDSDAWSKNIQLIEETIKPLQDMQWVRRIRMSLVYQVLKIHPMSYLDPEIKQRALESFLFALVSDKNLAKKEIKFEREHVEYMLSIDGLQHPLFAGIDCLPARDGTEDYKFSPQQFLDLRIPILKTVFKNLTDSVILQRQGRQDFASQNKSYIDACYEMFSAMRNIIMKNINDTPSPPWYQEYTDFCHQTISAIEEHQELFDTKLRFFCGSWRSYLKSPSWS